MVEAMDNKKLLGSRIKELRKSRGLTQERLAEELGIDPKHMSRLEVGRGYPSFETLENISKVLKIEMKEIFEFFHQEANPKELKMEIYRFKFTKKIAQAASIVN
jgi:transcriptional regulator with XRE-family HTH domain